MKVKINNFIPLRIINFILFFFKKLFFKKLNKSPRNIVVYRPGNLGDLICAIPSFYSIRVHFPDSKIYLVTSKGTGKWGASEIFNKKYFFDEIIDYSITDTKSLHGKYNLIKKLRSLDIDLWIDYGNQINNFFMYLRQIFIIKISKAKSAWCDKCIYFGYFVNYQNNNFIFLNETQRLNHFIESNGVQLVYPPLDIMHDDYYNNSILKSKSDYAVISIGSEQSHLNFWHVEKFVDLINYLSNKIEIVIIGSPNEIKKAKEITSKLDKKPINLVGLTTIQNLFSIFKNSKLVFGLDTGTQHIASFEGTNVVTITSCWNYLNTWTPEGNGKIITLRNPVQSKQCLLYIDQNKKRACINKVNCIEIISSQDAIEACEQII